MNLIRGPARSWSMFPPHARKCLGSRRVAEQREQQVLDRDEFVPLLARLDKGHVQADFKLLRNHSIFLHYARQRMLVAACEGRYDLLYLGGRDVAWVNAANASTFHVHFEHDLRRLFAVLRKILLQYNRRRTPSA